MIPGVREGGGSCAGRQHGAEQTPVSLFLQQLCLGTRKEEGGNLFRAASKREKDAREEKSSRKEIGLDKAKT